MATVRHRKPSVNGDSHSTPEWMMKALETEFRFTLDPCPLNPNWTKGVDPDGLELDWTGHRVYCNPPYSDILPWVQKAYASRAMTVFLLPCRSDTEWFHMLLDRGAEIRYMRKRMDFVSIDKRRIHPAESSIVAVVRNGTPTVLPTPSERGIMKIKSKEYIGDLVTKDIVVYGFGLDTYKGDLYQAVDGAFFVGNLRTANDVALDTLYDRLNKTVPESDESKAIAEEILDQIGTAKSAPQTRPSQSVARK